jgi:glutathione S-transferase
MKLYDFGPSANAQRVRVFLAEKGLKLDLAELNVHEGLQFEEPYTSMNPFHCVPFLELDDSTVIAESLSICRYLEELHPEPSLFGTTPEARATIDMWSHRVELDAYMPLVHAIRNKVPMFAGRVIPGTRGKDLAQMPEMIAHGCEMASVCFGRIDPHLANNTFLAGENFSIADLTRFFAVRAAKMLEMDIAGMHPNVERWFNEISDRPSFDL